MSNCVDGVKNRADIDNNKEKLDKLENKVDGIEKRLPKMDYMLEQAVEQSKVLSELMVKLDKTMAIISEQVERFHKDQKKLEERVEEVEENQKFNFISWMKNNLIGVLLTAGISSGVIYGIIEIVNKING